MEGTKLVDALAHSAVIRKVARIMIALCFDRRCRADGVTPTLRPTAINLNHLIQGGAIFRKALLQT